MVRSILEENLRRLEACRYRFGRNDARRIERLLNWLARARFTDAAALIRFHEALLFLRAFPQAPAVLRAAERLLNSFHKKVEAVRKAGNNMAAFEPLEVSGIAGTEMEDTLSFDVAKWLIERLPGKVEIAWTHYEPGRELGTIGPRFMPLLEDDAYVEADTPWRQWLAAAADKSAAYKTAAYKTRSRTGSGPAWLIACFDRMALPAEEKAALYESLRIPLRWSLNNSDITRTRNSKPARRVFYHSGPLISRAEVSLAEELARHPPRLKRVPLRLGGQIINMIREVMLVRYRELYGTTLGDPRSVVQADVGRGVTIYLWSLPPDRRLPLRAYVAGLTLKNGVPINYVEAIGLCEWMEVGFNTFYTFRGGEAGWIYAQVLRCLCQHMGTKCISVYPYQLGHENDEAIESGAFWFYRKLGFRPGRAGLQKLAEKEERKIASDARYRTSSRTLKRLAANHVFYELPGVEPGAWDKFSTRNIGLRINRRMARDFGGNAGAMRQHSRQRLETTLGVSTRSWPALERKSFENFALVPGDSEGFHAWTQPEKENLVQIIRAKVSPDETRYLKLMQSHGRLRRLLLRAGSPL